jgi:hypothetical protein
MLNRRLWPTVLLPIAGLLSLEILGLGSFGSAEQSVAAAPSDANEGTVDIARQEIALAKEALEIFTQLEQQGRADSDSVSIWSRRLVEATRKSGASKPDVVQALKDHIARMDQRVEIMKARRQSARTTMTAVLNAQYEALEARAWLAEEDKE